MFTIATLAISPFFLQKSVKVIAEGYFSISENIPIFGENTLLGVGPSPNYENSLKTKKINVIVTAYSSTPWETDDDFLITASGEQVRDGIVANNMLAFGTKIRLPEIYGDKVFIVKDRMHSRKGPYHVDIWFDSSEEALAFGAKYAKMEVLPY